MCVLDQAPAEHRPEKPWCGVAACAKELCPVESDGGAKLAAEAPGMLAQPEGLPIAAVAIPAPPCSSDSDLWGGTKDHQYCERIGDTGDL